MYEFESQRIDRMRQEQLRKMLQVNTDAEGNITCRWICVSSLYAKGSDKYKVIPRLTSDHANEDIFRCFADSANEYGFG